jgi:chromosome segregation ATPase
MTETTKMKLELEAALDKARSLHPLRQARERFVMELGNLPHNILALEMKGKTLLGERTRIEAELEKLSQQERELRQQVHDLFSSLVKASIPPIHEKIVTTTPTRRQLRNLLVEAAAIYDELEQVQRDWKIEVDALKKVARELNQQTGESYAIPEPPFVSPWVPAPTVQQIHRASTQGYNFASILEEMARQIG